jgi:hypothetical protein
MEIRGFISFDILIFLIVFHLTIILDVGKLGNNSNLEKDLMF